MKRDSSKPDGWINFLPYKQTVPASNKNKNCCPRNISQFQTWSPKSQRVFLERLHAPNPRKLEASKEPQKGDFLCENCGCSSRRADYPLCQNQSERSQAPCQQGANRVQAEWQGNSKNSFAGSFQNVDPSSHTYNKSEQKQRGIQTNVQEKPVNNPNALVPPQSTSLPKGSHKKSTSVQLEGESKKRESITNILQGFWQKVRQITHPTTQQQQPTWCSRQEYEEYNDKPTKESFVINSTETTSNTANNQFPSQPGPDAQNYAYDSMDSSPSTQDGSKNIAPFFTCNVNVKPSQYETPVKKSQEQPILTDFSNQNILLKAQPAQTIRVPRITHQCQQLNQEAEWGKGSLMTSQDSCFHCQQLISQGYIQLSCLHIFHNDCLQVLLQLQITALREIFFKPTSNAKGYPIILTCEICKTKIHPQLLINEKQFKNLLEALYNCQLDQIKRIHSQSIQPCPRTDECSFFTFKTPSCTLFYCPFCMQLHNFDRIPQQF